MITTDDETSPSTTAEPRVERRLRSTPWIGAISLTVLAAATIVSLDAPLGTAVYGPPLFPAAAVAFALVAVTAIVVLAASGKRLASHPARWAVFALAAVLLALMASPYRDRAAFPSLVLLLLPAATFLIAAWLSGVKSPAASARNLFRVAGAVGIGITVWGLCNWAIVDFGTETGLVDQLAGITGLELTYPSLLDIENPHPFGHKNFAAAFAVLLLPLLAGLVAADRTKIRPIWIAGVPLTLLYFVSAESRAGWLALAAMIAFALILWLPRLPSNRWKWSLIPLLAVIAAIPFLASPRLRETAGQIFEKGSLASLDPYRWEMAQVGLAAGSARPLTGSGPGTLPLVSPETGISANYPVVYQVHSTPLQLYAETGFAGLAGFLVLAGAIAAAWWRLRRSAADDDSEEAILLSTAAAAALAGYGVFALTDYQLDVPLIALLIAVPAGTILGLSHDASRRAPERSVTLVQRFWIGFVGVVILLSLPLLWWNANGVLARRHLARATVHLQEKDVESFFEETERAHRRAPTEPFYLNQAANVSLIDALRAEDPAEKQRLAQAARETLERSLEIAPAQDGVHFNLGVVLEILEHPAEALETFERASELNPRKRFAHFLRGRTLLALGRPAEAAEAFAAELLVNPQSLFLPLWHDPEIAPHLEARDEAFFRRISKNRSQKALRTGYLLHWWRGERSQFEFEGDLTQQPDGFQVIVMAISGEPEDAITAAPESPEAFLVRAWKEPEEAERWLRAGFFKAATAAYSHNNLHAIGDALDEGETFSDGFRALLTAAGQPAEGVRNLPRAPGLFERNLYGPSLYDGFVYTRPISQILLTWE